MPVTLLQTRPLPAVSGARADEGSRSAEPALVVHVECEQDIIDAVRTARERVCGVRPVGGKGSKNDCYRTDGVALDFTGYGGVLAFDGRTVTVQAGMKVGRLNEFLRRRGAIVPTCGEWQGATVGGSLATGSHGGSSRHGIHPTSILGLRMITAGGEVMEIDRSSPSFDHAGVSMGMLGAISTVTLACEAAFHLELETRVLSFERYLRDHAALNAAAEFFAAVWFPSARRVLTFSADRVPAAPSTGPRRQRFSVSTFVLDALSRYLDVNLVTDARLAGQCVDAGDLILCPIPDQTAKMQALRRASREWRAMEPAIPAAAASEVLERLDRLLREHRYSMLNAVGLRTSAADTFSLSPCSGRPVFWIDLFASCRDAGLSSGVAGLVEACGGRCHWGKHVALSADHLRRQYPRLDEFRELKAELDPNRLFANAYTRRIGL